MNKYKFLVLTDHSKHSNQNSLYALVAKLVQHPQCAQADVASRGNPKNDAFFHKHASDQLWALRADENFSFEEKGQQFLENTTNVSIKDYDVVFMRLPRPTTDTFLHYLKKTAHPNCIFVNDPEGIITTSSKKYLLQFPSCCPPMQLCHSEEEVLAFAEQYPMVLKPLKEYGGKGVVKIVNQVVSDGKEKVPLAAYLQKISPQLQEEGYLAMKYLKNVSEGDKRILVVNGNMLAASLRLPPDGSWLCNVAQGGRSVATEITPEEEAIINTITPALIEKGIVIFGADTLVDDNGKRVLSEINTLSIGGFPQSEQQSKRPVVQLAINGIFDYVNKKLQ